MRNLSHDNIRAFNSSGFAVDVGDGELLRARERVVPDTFLVAATFVVFVVVVVAASADLAAAGARDVEWDVVGFWFAILTTIKHPYRCSDEVAASVSSDVPTADQEW